MYLLSANPICLLPLLAYYNSTLLWRLSRRKLNPIAYVVMSSGYPRVVTSRDLISLPPNQFWSVKYAVVTKTRKNFEQPFIPIQAIQDDDSVDLKNLFKNF